MGSGQTGNTTTTPQTPNPRILTAPHATAVRLEKPPIIDGKIDEEEWKGAFTTDDLRDKVTGQPPADRTRVWAGYDDHFLYFAFRCYDSMPNRIVAREITPNSNLGNDDNVTVSVNTFGSRTWDKSYFTVNPLGTIREFIAGGRADKREWRGIWQAKTSRDDQGWSCEIAIPWRMLTYKTGGVFSMGLNFERWQVRTRIASSWANATQNEQPEFDGYWDNILPPPPPPARPQFLAYAAPELDGGQFGVRTGLDVRYPFNSSLFGLASIAPDFRNIENFVAGIDFTRVERYIPDARPFFNEGSDYFSMGHDYTIGDLLYSRRIGEFDLGAKVYGQLSPNLSIGALSTLNFTNQRTLVANVNARTSRRTFNAFALLNGNDGVSNSTFGVAGSRRFGSTTIAGSLIGERDEGEKIDSAGSLGVDYSVPRFFSTVKYYWVAPDFNPALGYIPWTDRKGIGSYSEVYKAIRNGPYRNASAYFEFNDFKTYAGDNQQSGFSTGAGLLMRSDLSYNLGLERYSYDGALDRVWNASVTVNASNRFRRYSLYYEDGVRNDQDSRYIGANASYRLGRRVDLGLSQSILEYGGTDSQTIVTGGYQLSPTKAISARAVQRNGTTNMYAAYRSSGARGTDLYVIVGDPNAGTFQPRVSVKLVWAF